MELSDEAQVMADGNGAAWLPQRRTGASAVPLDDNLAIYDDVDQLLILLNPSAAAIWEFCDGVTTADDMVEKLGRTFVGDPALIREDVNATLDRLEELGLIEDAGSRQPSSS